MNEDNEDQIQIQSEIHIPNMFDCMFWDSDDISFFRKELGIINE